MTRKEVLELAEARRFLASGTARRIRLDHRLSQGEIAGAVGVSASAISRWESGARRASGRPAIAYARLLKCLRDAVTG